MTHVTSTAKTGVCPKCKGKYTNILSAETLSRDNPTADILAFECPRCGNPILLTGVPGERIVKLETKPYPDN